MPQRSLIFFVNGKKVEDSSIDPEWTLLFYLRRKLRLTGAKLGCGEGGCGACTVMVSRLDRQKDCIQHFSVNACLTPVASMHGLAVTTIEGIGSTRGRLHPVQERISKAHGSQCGFCTPGIVMSMYTLLRNSPVPSTEEIEDFLTGNLCRCTGYRPVLEGFMTFASGSAGCGERDCCKLTNGSILNGSIDDRLDNLCNGDLVNGDSKDDEDASFARIEQVLFDPRDFMPYDPTQEVIFPPELKLRADLCSQELEFKGPFATYFRPVSLRKLVELKSENPEGKIICGNTEVGVEVRFKGRRYASLLSPSCVPELNAVRHTAAGIHFGAGLSLTAVQNTLREAVATLPEFKTRAFLALLEMLRWFGGPQIRNSASIGGNIMTASPVSDLNPVLLSVRASLRLAGVGGSRDISMDEHFFLGYRRTAVKPEEILVSVFIPFTQEDEYVASYKQSRRKEDDIAIGNASFKVKFEPGSQEIKDLRLAFGGMASTTVMARKTRKSLIGKQWDENLLQEATGLLLHDLFLDPSAPGGMVEYRQTLALSFFFKFYLSTKNVLSLKYPSKVVGLSPLEMSAIEPSKKAPLSSTQLFHMVPAQQDPADPIGRPIVHASALKQATGEAAYVDDTAAIEEELHAGFVLSSRARARIVRIDASSALAEPGVHSFISSRDIKKENNVKGVGVDEEIFARDEVVYAGQVVGVVLADDQPTARRSAALVKIIYEDIRPAILTIEDAIAAGSFIDHLELKKGDVREALRRSKHTLKGRFRIGGQEHFYLETHACIAIPKPEGEMEILCTSQNLTDIQREVGHALGVLRNKIVCKAKRLGGGFGGKETRSSAVVLPVAVAASVVGRPVRTMLDRDEDMLITGTRHPFLATWEVGYDDRGVLQGWDVDVYSNAGSSKDLSSAVMSVALLHIENVYRLGNASIRGHVCRTNLASNTAFRGFGAPQAMLIVEDMMTRVANSLQLEQELVRERNMFRSDGDLTVAGQPLESCTARRCWEGVKRQAQYKSLKEEVDHFNSLNAYKKRGIFMIPTKFGVAFENIFLNQGACLVLIYTDGSVLVTHGGVEMGQGLHTKMIQVASRVLGIPHEKIHISETSTDKVHNSTPTAGSLSSDIYGMAVLNACEILRDRLRPYKKKNPNGFWESWVKDAYLDRVPLGATGFHKIPEIVQYEFKRYDGRIHVYHTYGSAVSVVEVDILTGNHSILRTDIVMDIGNSLNPAVDIGQIEGAFMQGVGLFTLEELRYSPDGILLTRGPGAYKIPGFSDVPRGLHVSLLRDSPNLRAIFSSKAVGEPPLFLAASVFFALRDAVSSARRSGRNDDEFRFDSPATVERIRMACLDQFTDKVAPVEDGAFVPWSITV